MADVSEVTFDKADVSEVRFAMLTLWFSKLTEWFSKLAPFRAKAMPTNRTRAMVNIINLVNLEALPVV
jgi:hypothetical protein